MTTTMQPAGAEQRGLPPLDVPDGFWQREASHNPKPLTPMGSSIFIDGLNQSFRKVFDEFGLLVETLEYREIGGYVYNSVRPIGGVRTGALPPKPLLWLLLRTMPVFRKRLARSKRAVRSGLDRQLLDRWYDEWRPWLIDEIARLRAVELTSLSDDALASHIEGLIRFTFEAFDIHFYLSGANGWPIARLSFFCRDRLGYDDMRTMKLMSGLSSASSEPAVALADLAGRIDADGPLREALLAASARDVAALLRERDAPAAAAFDDYLERYGFRALRYEVVERTLGEQPELVAQLLQDQLRHPVDLRTEQERLGRERERAKQEALALLADEATRREFLALFASAERAYGVREDNEFFTVSVPLALCRFAALEAGRRLVARDALALPDDVFFLRMDEVTAALRGDTRDRAAVVAERRALHGAHESYDPPASFGEEPSPPPLDVLPKEARQAMETMIYLQEKIFEAAETHTQADAQARELRGRAAAHGTYAGTVRVIMGEHEFGKLQSGDVLVCPITSPVWSILFAKVGALVTDSGGILSHPAIIAREYGIPAVVATGNATSVLRDGQRVAVDGDAGVVRVLD